MSDAAHPSDLLMQQAYEQLQTGRFEEAVETFSTSLSLQPRTAQALRGRGLAYAQLQRWPLAVADFRAVHELAPEDLETWVDLATSMSMIHEQTYQAIEQFEQLLNAHPDCLRGQFELGMLHLRLGAIPKGRQHLQHALACRPSFEQRRQIESILGQQDKLDHKRFYRPDFEALHQQEMKQAADFGERLRSWWVRWRKK